MRQRGRPSSAGLTIVPPVSGREGRPEPPDILTESEARQWRQYVERMPPGWFPEETLPVLTELVQTIRLSEVLAVELREVKSLRTEKGLARFSKLLRLKLEFSARVAQLSTKLRLTTQSRLRSEKAYAFEQTARHPKPWDLDLSAEQPDRAESPPPDWSGPPT